MMDEKNTDKKEDLYHVSYENYLDTNACTECTGLMYNPAQSREEWDTYHEVFDFMPEAVPPKQDKKRR